jgi:hypothetical protein
MRFLFVRQCIQTLQRFIKENEIFQNYSPTMGHGRQWDVQHDIPMKHM